MKHYYTTLYLDEKATIDDVRNAYRKLVKKFHPDKNSGSDEYTPEFRKIQEAYDNLLNYFNNSSTTETHKENHYYTQPETETKNTQEKSHKSETDNKVVIKKIFSIGDTIELGYFRYETIRFDYNKNIGSGYFKSESDGIYLIIELKITNISSQTRDIHNYMYRLNNSMNDFFEFSSNGLSVLTMNQEKTIDYFGKDLNPKIPVKVKLIFEVPTKDTYFLTLCGGEYTFDLNSICISKEIETVEIK